MEAITPQLRAEMLARYQQFRAIARRLNSALVASLDREALYECGERLEILKGNTLVFDTEDTASVLMDYGIHHIRREGINAVQRYLAESPPPPGSDEMILLQSMCQVRYGLLQVEEVVPEFGVQMREILRDEEFLVLDIGFSQTAQRHMVIAAHTHSPASFSMTTGAALPVTADVLAGVQRQLERRFGKKRRDYRTLSQQKHTALATLIIRTCLQGGMSQRIRYADPRTGRVARS